ncbi:hypothetical protein lerEdw1_019543, partial [Lerista edwardsae]
KWCAPGSCRGNRGTPWERLDWSEVKPGLVIFCKETMECVPTKSFASPLKGFLILPPATYERKSSDMGCKLDDKPRPYVIGSMQRVNQKIAQLELGLKRFDSSDVVIETIDLRRQPTPKAVKRASRASRASKGKIAEKDQKVMQKAHMWTSDLDVIPHGKMVQKKFLSEKDKLVELYQYPGYNEKELTLLPNGIELKEILEKVIRAQRKTPIGKSRWSVKMLRKFLNAPCTQAILLDSFWWLFLHLYHPNQTIQGCLFERIAENYSRTLLGCHRVASQEDILKHFPSLLSQTVYTCFCYCFSRSWFNTNEFKAQLCDTIFEWIGGTRFAPGGFNKWDYSQLEPERSRREDLLSGKEHIGPENVPLPDQSMPQADKPEEGGQDSWHKRQSTPEKKRKIPVVPRESHPACGGPDFTWYYLNIHGHSPLIQHFLQKRHAEPKAGYDIFMPRREICKPIPYPYAVHRGKTMKSFWYMFSLECLSKEIRVEFFFTLKITESAQTYADLVKEGYCNLHQKSKDFKRTYRKHWREMRNFDQQCLESQELFR